MIFRIKTIADLIGVHRNTVTNWIKNGRLQAVPIAGKRYWIEEETFKRFCSELHVPVSWLCSSDSPTQSVVPKKPTSIHFREVSMSSAPIGSVLVVGAGIAGIQASLDLANSGYHVHLVEKSPGIGGVMAQLDKTYPTNDCAM
jgi:excisionase family DNA binding protein